MDLANMRQNGVRDLYVYCRGCHHSATVNVDAYPADRTVPSFAGVWPCGKCGSKNNEVRPAWHRRTGDFPLCGPAR